MNDDLKRDYDRMCDLIDRFKTRSEQKKSTIETKKKLDLIITKITKNIGLYDKKTRKEIRLWISEYETSRDSALLFESQGKHNEEKPATNNELLVDASATSKKTTQELKISLAELHQCEVIGQDAIITIENDNKKIKGIDKKIEEINTDAQMAQKLLNRFMKKIYTDKLIWCFLCIIALLIVIIVLAKYHIIKF